MVNDSIKPVTHQNKIVGTKPISIHIYTSRLQVLHWQRPGNNVQYSQSCTLLVSGSENLGYLITCVDLQISGYPSLEEALPTTPTYLPISCSVGESQIYICSTLYYSRWKLGMIKIRLVFCFKVLSLLPT